MKKNRIFKIIFIILICTLLFASINLLASAKLLSVSHYDYSNNKLQYEFTVVQLSDLHNSQFGKDNCRLLEKMEQESPDVILMTGDMLNSYEERTDIVTDLVRNASRIAPVYYSMGNHEIDYMENNGSDSLKQQLEEAGAIVLDGEYMDTQIAGQQVRIGGIYGYVMDYEWQDGSEHRFMEDFQDTDRFKILLSHMPEGLLLWKSMEHWNVDLVFSGHVHGGQMRLPFVGGLYDPEEGYFPTYTKGMFQCGNGTMILSAGLGSSGGIPRINNLPDLVVCKVRAKTVNEAAESENEMENINTLSAAGNPAADKLFQILRQFLEDKRIKVDDISDDLPGLLHLCEIHGLQPILYYMLGSDTEHLRECYPELEKRMRDQYIALAYLSIQQDAAAGEMAEHFRQAGIPLAFFKGTLLRSFYPEPQLRTMGDIDCVISREDRSRAYDLMTDMEYECESDKGDVWVYNRGRVSIEMHTRIAGNLSQNGFDYKAFFSDAIEHTEKNGNYIFLKREYHFCFLIYHIAKHLYHTGAGIRMFLDIAMFLRHYGDEFDWQQAEQLLQKTRLSKMAGAVFQLCNRWFGTDITWKDRVREEVLDQLETYIIDGGTFGFATHDVGDMYLRRGYEKSEKSGKHRFHFRLLWNYLFPSAENMLQIMPSVEKHRWLLPAAWIKRWWLGAFRRRSHSIHTMKSMFKDDDGRGQKEYQMLKELGL